MNEARLPHTQLLDVAHVGGGLFAGSFGTVCIVIWRSKPVRPTFEIQRATLASVVAAQPGRASFLCVVEATADPPNDDIRSASAKMINTHGNALAACACVIEGAGFRAAITRTVLTGITLVARTPVPFAFVDRVDVAAGWLAKRVPGGRLRGIEESVQAARGRLDAAG